MMSSIFEYHPDTLALLVRERHADLVREAATLHLLQQYQDEPGFVQRLRTLVARFTQRPAASLDYSTNITVVSRRSL